MPLSWQHGERAKEQLERCEGVHANYREYKKVQAHTVFITWLGRGGGGACASQYAPPPSHPWPSDGSIIYNNIV